MRVVIAAPLVAPLVPRQAGGAQAVVADLARGLAAAGEDVELWAPPGSRVTGVRLHRVRGAPFTADLHRFGDAAPGATERGGRWSPLQAGAWLGMASRLRAGAPDVVHAHALDWPAFYALAAAGLAQLHTLHLGPVDGASVEAAAAAARCRPRPHFITVSRWLASAWRPHLPVSGVVPNGVDTARVPFGDRPRPDLALVPGRISPEKGTELAVRAARAAGLRVVVAGPVYDRGYFDERVAPLLGDGVRLAGHLPRARLLAMYRRAAVAVVASLWEEPFGMVAVEAALAGTPVAGLASGALPEIVGASTGVLVEEPSAAALGAAVVAAAGLDRRAVRASVERRFGLATMVERYRRAYARIAGR